MKTIESNTLLNEPLRLEADDALDFGERKMPITSRMLIELTDEHTKQIEEGVFESLQAFGAQEKTLAMARTGLPTAIARADCTIDPRTGDIHLFESEERPAGMGVFDAMGEHIINRKLGASILGHLEQTFGRLPVVKRHTQVLENDDGMLLPVEVFTENKLKLRPEQPILVRAEPHHMTDHQRLEDATELGIAPIVEKGKRSYRIATGHATLLTNPKALPPNESVVLKTLQGSKARGVSIHLSKDDSELHGNRDTVTRLKAMNIIEREGAVIMEKFVPGIPVTMSNQEIDHMIFRVFCLINEEGAQAIGGGFMARPGHLVHGSHDAVSGLVLASKNEGLKT